MCSKYLRYKKLHTSPAALCDERKENPYARTLRILREDFRRATKKPVTQILDKMDEEEVFPSHVDVVIIGGAGVGSSIAYWLKEKSGREGLKVLVVEKDCSVSIYSWCD